MSNWYNTYVKSLRRDIVYLLIADCVFLLVMELWLRKIPAPFPIFVKIGDVLVTLGISFLASFIFFYSGSFAGIASEKGFVPCYLGIVS